MEETLWEGKEGVKMYCMIIKLTNLTLTYLYIVIILIFYGTKLCMVYFYSQMSVIMSKVAYDCTTVLECKRHVSKRFCMFCPQLFSF
jgi:hypothetical protein